MKAYIAPEVELFLFRTEDVLDENVVSYVPGNDETTPVFYQWFN